MAPSDEHGSAKNSETIIHASAIAIEGRCALFVGASGSGKSVLALQTMAMGATLVSDDRTTICRKDSAIIASAAPNIAGLIEVRRVGILHAPLSPPVTVSLVVDLDRRETERLPPWRRTRLLGTELPCLHRIEGVHFPAAILQYLRYGRAE